MTFSFIQITDHHLGESDQDRPYGYPASLTFRTVLDNIAASGEQFDFLVSTGDLVNRPTDASYSHLKDILRLSAPAEISGPHFIRCGSLQDYPIYLLPGNHDERKSYFRNLFSRQDLAHMNVSFLHKGVRFICLDWGALEQGELNTVLLAFLDSELSAGEPAVLLMHHNVIPLGAAWLDRFISKEISAFYECVRGRNVLGILCGHLHSTYERVWEGIPVLGLRSTAFQFRFDGKPIMVPLPPHYRVVTIEDTEGQPVRLTSRVVEVPLPAGISQE
jgi:Icc protein